jgi:hypothetical protein
LSSTAIIALVMFSGMSLYLSHSPKLGPISTNSRPSRARMTMV